eukprot:4750001-Amphidinium_carterae.3
MRDHQLLGLIVLGNLEVQVDAAFLTEAPSLQWKIYMPTRRAMLCSLAVVLELRLVSAESVHVPWTQRLWWGCTIALAK